MGTFCIVRDTMDSAKLEDLLQQLAEIVFNIDRDITEIKVSIAALKTFTAVQVEPEDPKAGMLRIESLEAEERKVDPGAEEREKITGVVDALKLVRQHGFYET
jgi:hypothetical protein